MNERVLMLCVVATASACMPPPKALPKLGVETRGAALPSTPPSEKALQAKLKAVVVDVPLGHVWGREAWGSQGYCTDGKDAVNTEGRFEFELAKLSDVFHAVMVRRGFPVEDELELFEGSKKRVADLQVAGRVIDATLNECYPTVFKDKLKVVGSAWLKIEWSVFSTLEKKVILTVVTEGSTFGEVASTVGQTGIVRPAFEDAVERLVRSEAYRKVVDPPAASTAAPPVAAGTARIRIRRARAFSGGMQANVEAIRRAVATITANRGSGSGFVISEDGKVVTAEHVVSGSRYVKVTTGAGKECYGEVVATSKMRDLAIVSVDCKGLSALPFSTQRLAEGVEVFAVGTPLSDTLQFSVTKGVVSAVRKIDSLEYIQSDVTVLAGSSGGPLLDRAGNAIGVTTMGVVKRSVPVGVNFFVPLWDLDKHLPIDVVE
jgi:S1-C subfamily serine protease